MRTKNRRASRWMAMGLSCLALCLSVSTVAQAIPVTFSFEEIIFNASSPLNLTIPSNTPIGGSYTFESTSPDLFSGPSQGIYALSNFSVIFLGRTYSMISSTGLREIRVLNSSTSDTYSVLLIPTGIDQALSGPSISGLAPRSFQFNISGIGLFTSDALPLVPPPLPNGIGTPPIFNMGFAGGGITAGINGRLTSLTAVSEPSAPELTGMGLFVLIAMGMCRRRMGLTD